MKKISTKVITTLGVLIAIEVVLSRFLSINAWNIKIGFNFVPIAVAAILYGPIAAAAVAGLGDFIGAILFPIGPYFPAFTLTAVLTGVVLGVFLHKQQKAWNILGAVAINQFILGLLLNTLWISVLYDSPYWPLFATRIIQALVLTPVQFVVIGMLVKALPHLGKKAVA